MSGVHSRFLELLKRSARLDTLVLASVSDQKHTIAILESMQEFINLPSTGETRFIENIEVRLPCSLGTWLRKKMLQCACLNARILKLLSSARRWGKPLDGVSLLLGGPPNRRK